MKHCNYEEKIKNMDNEEHSTCVVMGKHETLIIIYLLQLSTVHSTDEREVL